MTRRRVTQLLAAGALLVGCRKGDPTPPPANVLLARGRAGDVRLGMTLEELYRVHPKSHTRLTDVAHEGMPTPAIEVYPTAVRRDRPLLIGDLEQRNGRFAFARLHVLDRRFRTPEGLGIGSTLADLRRAYGDEPLLNGEGTSVYRAAQLGLSFVFADYPAPAVRDSAKVDSVLVVG